MFGAVSGQTDHSAARATVAGLTGGWIAPPAITGMSRGDGARRAVRRGAALWRPRAPDLTAG